MENEERKYSVYMHMNKINEKKYIGMTGKNPPEKRWASKRAYEDCSYFYNAINYYGWENFSHEILFTNLTRDEAMEKEIEMIAYYNSTNKNLGYNLEQGGKCCLCATKRPVKQYTMDGEFVALYDSIDEANNSIEHGDVGSCCANINKTAGGYIWRYAEDELTQEHIAWCNHNGIYDCCSPVDQYSKDGVFIRRYSGVAPAAEATGGNHSNIVACCTDRKRTANGFIWRYADEELTPEHLAWCNENRNKWRMESVKQYSKDGKFIAKFNSIKEASKRTNINKNSIAACCRKEHKVADDFIWLYSREELTPEHIKWCNSMDNGKSTKKRKVCQYTLAGEFIAEYPSIAEASRNTGVLGGNISAYCQGKTKPSGGYIWRYAGDEVTQEYLAWCNSKREFINAQNTGVRQYTKKGEFVAEYDSIASAEDATGVQRRYIVECCKDNIRSSGGFKWEFVNSEAMSDAA